MSEQKNIDSILASLNTNEVELDNFSFSSKKRFTVEEDLLILACRKAGITQDSAILAVLNSKGYVREGKGHVVSHRWRNHIMAAMKDRKANPAKYEGLSNYRQMLEKYNDYK